MQLSKDQRLLVLLCLAKICLVYLLIYLAYSFFQFNVLNHRINFNYPPGTPITWKSAFLTWDAKMYYYIAERGYAPVPIQGKDYYLVSAFYPLYPFAIRALSLITTPVIAGFLISNLCFVFGTLMFYKLSLEQFGSKIATNSIIFLLLFPTSFFFSLIYTEALFFFLLLALFYSLRKENVGLVFLFSLLLGLTRGVGLFLFFPLFYHYFFVKKEYRKFSSYLACSAPILGFVLTQVIISFYTGDFWSGFSSQNLFASKNTVGNIFSPVVWFQKNFLETDLALHGITNSIIDRTFFVLLIPCLVLIWKKQSRESFLLTLFLAGVTATMGNFCAYTRYLLVVFPIFICLAQLQESLLAVVGAKRLLGFSLLTLVYVSFVFLQIYFLLRHSLFEWAA